MKKRLIILTLTVIFVLGCSASLFSATIPEISQQEEQEIVITSNTFIKIAQEAQKFVVSILVTKEEEAGEKWRAIGSGIVIDKEGYILTNNHVIEEAEEITVTFDSEICEAQIIGSDPVTDLALLKIEPKEKLTPALLGDSDKIKVGQWVVAIGSPFGLSHTVTCGIISGKERRLQPNSFVEFIQTSAQINPGNSGGPLLNLKGEVIGINTIIFAEPEQGTWMGIGFAIPINIAKEIVSQLKTKGKIIRGWSGILCINTSYFSQEELEAYRKHLGLEKLPQKKGLLVYKVLKNSPAEKAGIKRGDIVLEFNGKKLEGLRNFGKMILTTKPGTVVKIKIYRYGEILELLIKIEERKNL